MTEGSVSDPSNVEIAAEGRKECARDQCYRLFNRQRSIHQIIGGGKGTLSAVVDPFKLQSSQCLLPCYCHSRSIQQLFCLQVVVILWLLSVVGSFFTFFTLAYIGMLFFHSS
ncbi:hypothetical protein B296_00040709 [Ensete ventricosum]|uniref:Uncharacterized protein n=1 Tax=Ensete ventricosum TaxID=4639 RepID=A0A426XU07_ENSVE|nr:hypothetical protein B296_00040709 [Ensete ventricosum]